MKKQANMLFAIAALLTLTSFSPKTFWQGGEEAATNRFPASEETSDLEESSVIKMLKAEDIGAIEIDKELLEKLPEIKEYHSIKELTEDDLPGPVLDKKLLESLPEIKVACKREEPSLQEDIKELVKKNKLLLEKIAKLEKGDKDDEEEKPSKKKKKFEAPQWTSFQRSDYSSDYMMVMSQMTALMYSQQQMQSEMMSQMFSMMPKAQSRYETDPLAPYYNRYSYVPNNSFVQYESLRLSDDGIGVRYEQVYKHHLQQQQPQEMNYSVRERMPSQEQRFPNYRGENSEMNMHAPQFTSPVPHEGFNFSGTSMGDFNRMQF